MSKWGEVLKSARDLVGMTQVEAANRTGLSRNTIINYEKGYRIPGADELELLGKVYKQTFVTPECSNPPLPREKEEVSA
ncbi:MULTISPECIES: helix-turn-helix domain-containing protein [Dethiosulfovibrio]|uniref:Helix-turn-helix domain-containing protein n=2 Tax=Dethiosulfovibrio TaxID=47054 RepID=A0ABS9EPF9_9BACT|nr:MULTISPECIES: helix-turn-helix transcriptional regulator [Dethiosulfovibrio]MCF4114715.1 helix-turn-helix domain-containing protein [Dethiosulfovibrio russensis]MCF4143080.1 helix-turn-helix domain-containing protein [Dethiosulfovibrio marinus]MCF4145220.1 helix-turn-helix domain-containing protein [Dethiosulfovibrio acidaminovorans]